MKTGQTTERRLVSGAEPIDARELQLRNKFNAEFENCVGLKINKLSDRGIPELELILTGDGDLKKAVDFIKQQVQPLQQNYRRRKEEAEKKKLGSIYSSARCIPLPPGFSIRHKTNVVA
jgi:hypothetical protein